MGLIQETSETKLMLHQYGVECAGLSVCSQSASPEVVFCCFWYEYAMFKFEVFQLKCAVMSMSVSNLFI